MSTGTSPRPRSCFSLTTLLLCTFTLAYARETPPVAPPQQPAHQDAVTRVTAAKNIFLSNAGGNNYFNGQITGGPNASYNELYAALKQWGYFHLVDTPAQADLIFQIRGAETMPELRTTATGYIIPQQHPPMFELAILDPHSDPSTPIDTITVMAGRADDISKGEVAFARSIEWLTYQISKLVNVPPPSTTTLQGPHTLRPSFETLMHSVAPVPPQVLDAKTIYVDTDTKPKDPYYQGFLAALNTWAYYRLTDTSTSADIVLHYHRDLANGTYVTLTPPNSKTILWTITDPHYGFYNKTGQHRISALTQNLISELKLLNHISLSQTETAALH